MAQLWDVFVSYARSDAEAAVGIGRALREAGLQVFWDEAGVLPFHSISDTILRELGNTKVLLAYYSQDYPRRHACQHELTTAFLAGHREGDPRRRVLVVNPENGTDHIDPIELRDARHVVVPHDNPSRRLLAAEVSRHVASLTDTIADIEQPAAPLWHGTPPRVDPIPFVGRQRQLWRLHSALHDHHAPLTSNRSGRIAIVHGMVGTGKSRLALEYAHRFGTAFPGGIYWLGGRRHQLLENLRREQTRRSGLSSDERRPGHTDCATGPRLWILDNVPPGITPVELGDLLPDDPAAHIVLTSTDNHYSRLGTTIGIGRLADQDATLLLSKTWPDADTRLLREIADAADGHPEALAALMGFHDPDTALTEFHSHGPRALASLADRIFRDVEHDPTVTPGAAMDAFRAITVLEPAPMTIGHLATVLGRLHGLGVATARNTTQSIVESLHSMAVLRKENDQTVTTGTLVGHLARVFDPDRRRRAQVRTLTLQTRRTATPRAGAVLRMAAWRLQVELAHRILLLENPDVGLRDAIASLYSLVSFTRNLLADSGPSRTAEPIQQICTGLLTHQLRPLLTHWHPELLKHEHLRPGHIVPTVHEQQWNQAVHLRNALSDLGDTMTDTLHALSRLTGSKHGLSPKPLATTTPDPPQERK